MIILPANINFVGNMAEFKAYLLENSDAVKQISALREEVETFARQFPIPGFDNH